MAARDANDIHRDHGIDGLRAAFDESLAGAGKKRGTEAPPKADTKSNSGSLPPNISAADFYAYMPMHTYIFAPTGQMWPAASVNARLGKGATIELDQTRAVEQMTWAPGYPELITDRLIADGGWITRPGVTCYNQRLRAPPLRVSGDVWP